MYDWISALAPLLAIAALVLAVLSYRHSKAMSQEFDSSLGTPAVQVHWGNPTEASMLSVRLTAVFNRVSSVSLSVEKQGKVVDKLGLQRAEWKGFELKAAPEGARFKLAFTDPVEQRKYKKRGVVRYGQLDLL